MLSGGSEQIGQTIQDVLLVPKVRADNIVIFSDMMITRGFGVRFDTVIKQYVDCINKEAKFFFMDISGYGRQTTFGEDLKSKNCFLINGMSDNVLKYIAEAGKISQVEDVKLFSMSLNKGLMQIE